MKLYQIRHTMYHLKQRTILLQNKQKYNINRRKFHSFLPNKPNNPEPQWLIIMGGLSYYYFMKWYNNKK